MKKYVAGMVIYPPDNMLPKWRKHIVYYQINEERAADNCWTGNYEHHSWVSDKPIKIGSRCLCGKEKAIPDSSQESDISL